MEDNELAAAIPEMLRLAHELIPMLLQGEDPRMQILQQQWPLATVTISQPSPCGFYADISVPREAPRVVAPSQCSGNADIPVHGCNEPAGCILYVVDGSLQFLEVYNVIDWSEPPVFEHPQNVQAFVFNSPDATVGHSA
jgi:hypothetical protein